MARRNIDTIALPPDQLKEEINRWAVSTEDMLNLTFLKAVCQAFYNEVEKYYKAGAKPEDRLQRLDEICQALIAIGFEDGKDTFTISGQYRKPPTSPDGLLSSEGWNCDPGQRCIRGVCMP